MQAKNIAIAKEQKIDSLQALRAWAFLGVFLEHTKYYYRWPAFGVSIFFIMSGFLLTYRYENVELSVSLKKRFLFSWNKIKKLYPLHIMTMLCAVILTVASFIRHGASTGEINRLILKVVSHVTLLQTWIPDCTISISLIEPAWFLSTLMFLYFTFPWMKRLVERQSLMKLCLICVLILLAEIAACIPVTRKWGNPSVVYIWFMYCFPIFRLGDLFIGCVLKRLFFECKVKDMGTVRASIYELLATGLTLAVFFWCAEKHSNTVLDALDNWTTPYIPIAAIWVLLFAANKGLISRALTNRISIAVGNISPFAFLIHFVVVLYTPYLLSLMNISASGRLFTVIVLAELLASILLSFIYKYIDENYISKIFFAGRNKSLRT